MLCQATDTTCTFSAVTALSNCQIVCGLLGGRCLGAQSHANGHSQQCHAVATDSCTTSHASEICTCTR
jgi:hypothetical protein